LRDLEQDVVNAQTVARNSEFKRQELQVHIKQTSVTIQEQALENKTF
jgi:hypothetical protein